MIGALNDRSREIFRHIVDAYVETAAKLAEDKATIRALKKDLRTMVRASPMCRKEEFTRDWETTLLKAAG